MLENTTAKSVRLDGIVSRDFGGVPLEFREVGREVFVILTNNKQFILSLSNSVRVLKSIFEDFNQYSKVGEFYSIVPNIGEDLSGSRFEEGIKGIAKLRLNIGYDGTSGSKFS